MNVKGARHGLNMPRILPGHQFAYDSTIAATTAAHDLLYGDSCRSLRAAPWRRAVALGANVTVCRCYPNADLADWSHRRS